MKDLTEAAREFVADLCITGSGEKAGHIRLFSDTSEDAQYYGGYSEEVLASYVARFSQQQIDKAIAEFVAEVEKVDITAAYTMREVAKEHGIDL